MRTLLSIIIAFSACEIFAAGMSKEPVIITNCRAFPLRGDEESKTGLASRFANVQSDCDEINKVALNQLLDVSGISSGQNGIFKFRAFYPQSEACAIPSEAQEEEETGFFQSIINFFTFWESEDDKKDDACPKAASCTSPDRSYEFYIMYKVFPSEPARTPEFWISSDINFAKSTYAIATSDADKAGSYYIMEEATVAPSIVPEIFYALAQDFCAEGVALEARRTYSLGLLKMFEFIVGGSEGYTQEFVQSPDWLDKSKRIEALKTLRNYMFKNFANIKIDNSLDADGKNFADYMKLYSDQMVEQTKRITERKEQKFNIEETIYLDDASYAKAKKIVPTKPNFKSTQATPFCTETSCAES